MLDILAIFVDITCNDDFDCNAKKNLCLLLILTK